MPTVHLTRDGAAGDHGTEGSHRSVADDVDAESLTRVRATEQETGRAATAAEG